MFKPSNALALVLAVLLLTGDFAQADNADTANKSNSPLNLAPGANLQDYYTPLLYDTNAHTNDLLLRGTLPLSTRPDPRSGYSRRARAMVYPSSRCLQGLT